jgi:chorismate mutase/prephenate dehydratase
MDNLVESDLLICSQVYLPIEHCLLSNCPLSEVTAVYSKDQALGQCREWLRRNLPEAPLVEVASTGAAAEKAATIPGIAAIASELSAELNKLPILERGIQVSDHNTTRFLVLGRTQAKPLGEGRDKTSLVISLSDQPGALEQALRPFARRGINLTKIESRPSRKKAWDYYFFIDLIGHISDTFVAEAIDELRLNSLFVKWLGSYPNN